MGLDPLYKSDGKKVIINGKGIKYFDEWCCHFCSTFKFIKHNFSEF